MTARSRAPHSAASQLRGAQHGPALNGGPQQASGLKYRLECARAQLNLTTSRPALAIAESRRSPKAPRGNVRTFVAHAHLMARLPHGPRSPNTRPDIAANLGSARQESANSAVGSDACVIGVRFQNGYLQSCSARRRLFSVFHWIAAMVASNRKRPL